MTGSISNQFTNEISMLLYYNKYFIIQIPGNVTHWIHVSVRLMAIPVCQTRDISRYLGDNIYIIIMSHMILIINYE